MRSSLDSGNMLAWLERSGVDTGPLRDLARQNKHLLGRGE